MAAPNPPEGFVTVANIEVDSVLPRAAGFQLQGRGADAADYVLEMHLDLPIDRRTRAVLGEILSQSEWVVARRPRTPLRSQSRLRARARPSAG